MIFFTILYFFTIIGQKRFIGGKEKVIQPVIEFCVSNLANGSQRAKEVLEKDPDFDVIEYGCVGYCGICNNHLFALVNGEVVKAATPEELVQNIYTFVEENLM